MPRLTGEGRVNSLRRYHQDRYGSSLPINRYFFAASLSPPNMDGIAKVKDRGVKFGRKRELTDEKVEEIRALRELGETVPAIIKRTGFSKASIYRALGR